MKKLLISLSLLTIFSFDIASYRSVYDIPLLACDICTLDYDFDGDIDIIINHGIDDEWGGLFILQNDGYGNLSFYDSIYDITGSTSYADTVISKTSNDIIYRTPDSFAVRSYGGTDYDKYTAYAGPKINDFTLGDLNGDGFLDIVFYSNNLSHWGVVYNNGDMTFSDPVLYNLDRHPMNIACGDIDQNGRDDVIIGGITRILYSYDTGFVEQKLQDTTTGVGIGDFDGDGDLDIISYAGAAFRSFGFFYENIGDKSFTSYFFNPYVNLGNLTIEDFNNDSVPDLLFANGPYSAFGYLVYYNFGEFTLENPIKIELETYAEARRYVHIADIDGNEFNDIITTRTFYNYLYNQNPLEILFNDGKGNFVPNPLNMEETSLASPTPKLIKLIDLSGREIMESREGVPYIEVFDDGSTWKRMDVK